MEVVVDQVTSMEVDVSEEEEASGTRSGCAKEVDPKERIPGVKVLNLDCKGDVSNIAQLPSCMAACLRRCRAMTEGL